MSDTKNRRYDTVVFDLDGTLLDTLADLTSSTNAVMEQYGMHGYTQEQVRSFVGNGIRRLLERAVTRQVDAEEFKQIHRSFREHYDLHCMDETEPYPGILSLLDWLDKEGYRIAIVSNKADFAVKKLRDIYFKDLVPVAIGEQECCRRKPAPDSVFRAMRELYSEKAFGNGTSVAEALLDGESIPEYDTILDSEVIPEQNTMPDGEVVSEHDAIPEVMKMRTVYVGDSEVDLQTAANAGIDCIAVSWGFRSREFLLEQGARAEWIAANVNELKKLLSAEQ